MARSSAAAGSVCAVAAALSNAPSVSQGESFIAVDTAEVRASVVDDDDARRPLMTAGNIAWMNLGFFGVQFSFGLTQTAVNPIFLLLGAKPEWLPILNIAGPITGLFIQPFIGAT